MNPIHALKVVLHNRDIPFEMQPVHQVAMVDLANTLGNPECIVVGDRFVAGTGDGFIMGTVGGAVKLDRYDISQVLTFLKGA